MWKITRQSYLALTFFASVVHSKQRSRKEQPSKSVAGPVLTEFARRAALSGTRGRRGKRWSHLLCFSLFLHPLLIFPPRVCVCHILTQCVHNTSRLRTFSFVSNFNTCILGGSSCNQKFKNIKIILMKGGINSTAKYSNYNLF